MENNWHNSAVQLHTEQQTDLAIQHQIMATKAYPYGGPVWDTLGNMLLAKAAEQSMDGVPAPECVAPDLCASCANNQLLLEVPCLEPDP